MARKVVDELVTKYTLDDQYSAKAKQVTASTKDVDTSIGRAQGVVSGLGRVAGMAAAAVVAAGGAIAAFAWKASQAAAKMESLQKGLIAVAGSEKEAAEQMERLKEVAKLPGLGFEEAIQGSINLQAAGMSAESAEAALMAFGNALATVGKGKEELFGVITALTQITAKGKVSAEEILQLQERLPQIRQAMLSAFGTSDTEALGKMGVSAETFVATITAEFAKLPKVTAGAQNAFENLNDSMNRAFAAAGGPINELLIPIVDDLASGMEELANSGAIKDTVQSILDMFNIGPEAPLVDALVEVLAITKGIAASVQNFVQNVEGLRRAGDASKEPDWKKVRRLAGGGKMADAPVSGDASIFESVYAQTKDEINMTRELARRKKERDDARKAVEGQTESPPEADKSGRFETGQNWLADIANSSRLTARNTGAMADARKHILGGGDMGRMGITAVEMNAINRRPVIQLQGGNVLGQALSKVLDEYMEQMARQGWRMVRT